MLAVVKSLQAYRGSTRELCKAYVRWADEQEQLDRDDFRDYDSAQRALRSYSAATRSSWSGAVTEEMRQWTEEEAQEQEPLTAEQVRAALLALRSGVMSEVNGVPVSRVPCEGVWFDVGICEVDAFFRPMQMLRLADATSRCKSGYYPTLKPMYGPAAHRASLDRLAVEMGWTTPYEDTPEWHRKTGFRSLVLDLGDGEHPAWQKVLGKWLGRRPEVTEHPRVDMCAEATALGLQPDYFLMYSRRLARTVHGPAPATTKRHRAVSQSNQLQLVF